MINNYINKKGYKNKKEIKNMKNIKNFESFSVKLNEGADWIILRSIGDDMAINSYGGHIFNWKDLGTEELEPYSEEWYEAYNKLDTNDKETVDLVMSEIDIEKPVRESKNETKKETKKDERNEISKGLTNDYSTTLNREMKKIWDFNNFSKNILERDILTAGKFVDLGKIKGYINRIEGDTVYIETIDGSNEMKEVSITDIPKHYKIETVKEETYKKPELKEGTEAIANPIDKKSKIEKDDKLTNKIFKVNSDLKLKNNHGGPK